MLGAVYGAAKWALYRDAWVVVVPSRVEAPGMVNLEAAACGTPTIASARAGLSDWGGGGNIVIEPEVDAVAGAIVEASRWSDNERAARGSRARSLVQERYGWDVVGGKWEALYRAVARVR